jgi:Co/Zn/Cd efflux system component
MSPPQKPTDRSCTQLFEIVRLRSTKTTTNILETRPISDVTMLESQLEDLESEDVDQETGQDLPTGSSGATKGKGPSNVTLLSVAFISFSLFSIVQLMFSIVAGSSALLGDSVAMMVDAFTYFVNWYAEREKARYFKENAFNTITSASELARRKRFLRLEIIPSLLSVVALLTVTIIVLNDAVHVIMIDSHRAQSQQGTPDLDIMMILSICNLAVDLINVICFYRGGGLLGYATVSHSQGGKQANLNMCSAYTHVFADTLRGVAVLAAAGIAKVVPNVTPEIADATAAIVVSIVIAFTIMPLLHGLVKRVIELRLLVLEERAKSLADVQSMGLEDAAPDLESGDEIVLAQDSREVESEDQPSDRSLAN